MNKNKYSSFLELLKNEDKDKALMFILNLLNEGENIIEIYENLLIPSLSDFSCLLEDGEICIWKEHTRTSIIRTILEASYTYIIKSRKKSINKKIIVLCPHEEYHEIGAIIANNYFYLVGFNSSYIGANTPSDDILSAIKVLKPDYIALSVTNYYNLVITRKLTNKIRTLYPTVKIILGGQAFSEPNSLAQVKYDYNLVSYQDILDFTKEVEE
jgi:methanogenic corrinoid protein MtbC1